MAFNALGLTPEQELRLAPLPGKWMGGSGHWAALQSVHGSFSAPVQQGGNRCLIL